MKRLLAGLAALLVCGVVSAFDLPQVTIHALPPEAQTTLRLIDAGGPFPYGRDGIMFGNRERILPTQARGYYREFTVPTPGVNHRGPRRIVTMMTGAESIRDVIAFPKTQRAQCLLTDAPSDVDEKQLRELHIRLRQKVETVVEVNKA